MQAASPKSLHIRVTLWQHVLLVLVAWASASLPPLIRLSFVNRDLPPEERHGHTCLPTMLFGPLVFLPFVFGFGPTHAVSYGIAGLHAAILTFDLVGAGVEFVRGRRSRDPEQGSPP